MIKKGFTLAELLITMGIIGVVAALVAPGLIINNRNAANASKLSSTVSDLENAFTTMIVKEQVDDIFETEAWDKISGTSLQFASGNDIQAVGAELGKYTYIVPTTIAGASVFYANTPAYNLASDGAKGTRHSFGSGTYGWLGAVYNLKSGAVMFANLNKSASSSETDDVADEIAMAGGSLVNSAGQILIDVNGKSAPNTLGRDIFAFDLGSDGHLYPMGGRDFAIHRSKTASWSESDIWKNEDSKTACTDTKKAEDGLGCTARLIEEGYKVTY